MEYNKNIARFSGNLEIFFTAMLVCFLLFIVLQNCSSRYEPKTPEEYYKIAVEKSQGSIFRADYDMAEEYFRKIIELFPGSKYVPLAKFGIAYTKMKKGDYIEAGILFEEFHESYRSHPKAPEALYYAIECHKKFLDTPDRDIEPAKRLRQLTSKFLELYPDNEKAGEIKKLKDEVLSIIAQRNLEIAQFYIRRKIYLPALERLEIIINDPELKEKEEGKVAQKLYNEIKKNMYDQVREVIESNSKEVGEKR